MRRKDREVTDFSKIIEIIEESQCFRLGLYDGQEVYIVPLVYGFESIQNELLFYFHGAKQGRKTEILHTNPNVAFEIDQFLGTKKKETSCEFITQYQSIIGNGHVTPIEDYEKKTYALNLIISHYTQDQPCTWSEEVLDNISVFKLEVTKLSAKESI